MSVITHISGDQYTLEITEIREGTQPEQPVVLTGADVYFEVYSFNKQTEVLRKQGTVTSGASGVWQVDILSTNLTIPGTYWWRSDLQFGNSDRERTEWKKLVVNG